MGRKKKKAFSFAMLGIMDFSLLYTFLFKVYFLFIHCFRQHQFVFHHILEWVVQENKIFISQSSFWTPCNRNTTGLSDCVMLWRCIALETYSWLCSLAVVFRNNDMSVILLLPLVDCGAKATNPMPHVSSWEIKHVWILINITPFRIGSGWMLSFSSSSRGKMWVQ